MIERHIHLEYTLVIDRRGPEPVYSYIWHDKEEEFEPPPILQCKSIGDAKGSIKVSCGRGTYKQQARECDKYKRCLPSYKPTGKLLEDWNKREESSLYHLCQGCTEFEAE